MRILRSRSDQEISSTGFALFIAGLILAGFIGGAIRTLLSSNQIQDRILTELQAALPSLQVKMDQAKVTLARGIWPGLSISIPKLHLIKPEACGETYGSLELSNIDLPLDIFPLLRSRVHWDVVSVGRLNLLYTKKPCPPGPSGEGHEAAASTASKVESSLSASAENVREHIAHGFAIAEQLRDHLRGVHVDRAEIASTEDSTWLVAVSNFDMRTGRRLTMSANIHFEKSFVPGKIEHDAMFRAELNPQQLKWDVRSPWKEGLISWTGTADQANDSLDQRVTVRQLPLRDVLLEVQTWARFSKGGSPRFIWLSCDLGQSGALSQFKSLPMEVSDCKIDGEGEQIRAVPGQQVWPWERTPLHQPLRFQVNQLSLQDVFDLFATAGLPAIIPKPGQWTGEIQFSNPHTWQLEGTLAGAEIAFSNQSIRAKQVVNKMRTVVQSEEKGVSAELSEIALADGTCDGKLSCRLDSAFKNGECNVNLSALSLNPVVQNLMTDGVSSPISVMGRAVLKDGKLSSWKGQAQWKSTEGHGWKVADSRLDTTYQDGRFSARLRLQEAELGSEFAYSDVVQTVLGPLKQETPWRLKDGSVNLTVVNMGGEIKDLHLRGPSGRAYRFRGEWERGGDLIGTLSAGAKKWKVSGRDGRLSLDELR